MRTRIPASRSVGINAAVLCDTTESERQRRAQEDSRRRTISVELERLVDLHVARLKRAVRGSSKLRLDLGPAERLRQRDFIVEGEVGTHLFR